MTVPPSHPVPPQTSRPVPLRVSIDPEDWDETTRRVLAVGPALHLQRSGMMRALWPVMKAADILLTWASDRLQLLGSRAGLWSGTQEKCELTRRSSLIPAAGWWLVERLDDSSHPHVWARQPVAAFTLGRRGPGRRLELVAVLGDGRPQFLRAAAPGRDGSDYLTRSDALHVCMCDVSPTSVLDSTFCSYCGGKTYG